MLYPCSWYLTVAVTGAIYENIELWFKYCILVCNKANIYVHLLFNNAQVVSGYLWSVSVYISFCISI